jgi:hypothetical protein
MPGPYHYNVPTTVAVTTALAAGSALFGGSVVPPNAVPVDLPVSRIPVSVAGGASLTITWPAIAASGQGQVTAIGISTSDAQNTRITTQIDGVAVPPYQATIGAIGSMDDPTLLSVPIRLAAGQVFSLLLENISGAAIDLAARTMGWTA